MYQNGLQKARRTVARREITTKPATTDPVLERYRAREESRRWFDEERCLTKCESNCDEDFSELLCAADRRLVRSLDAATADDPRAEARVLQDLARSLRRTPRCEDSFDPDACATHCDANCRTELEISNLPLVY